MKTMTMNDFNDVVMVIPSIDDVDSLWREQSGKSEHLDWDRLLIMNITLEDEEEIHLYTSTKCLTINQCLFPQAGNSR